MAVVGKVDGHVLDGAREEWSLDPRLAHFNAGPSGAVPRQVQEEQARLRQRSFENPHRFNEFEVFERFGDSRNAAASLLGAAPGDIAFVPNVTTGVATVFASLPLARGDEVLISDHAYATTALNVRRACLRAGASMVEAAVDLDLNDDEIVDCIAGYLTDRTTIAVVDHVASPTGLVFPVAAIAKRLKEHGVTVVVDGAHAVASVELAVADLGVDVWVGSFHKWLGAPKACAALYVSSALQSSIESLVASHFDDMGFPNALGFQGAADHTARLCIPAAMAVHEAIGWDRIRHHARALATAGLALLLESTGLGSPVPDGSYRNLVAVRLPKSAVADAEAGWKIAGRLSREAGCEVAITTWRGDCFLRLAVHATSTLDDFARLAAALRRVLA